jgi:hypothetical protein
MALKQVLDVYEVMDSAKVDGETLANLLREGGVDDVKVERIHGEKGFTDCLKALIPGKAGKSSGGAAPTLGVIGRLGGLGARPERIGFVSDGEGALAAVATALKLGTMRRNGDELPGDVIVATHICPDAPVIPHDPVPFMGSPVSGVQLNAHEVDDRMDAILSVDTTKGNRIINQNGFAISPTVLDGYILRVSDDLLDQMQWVTGKLPAVFAITQQDITPYGNDLFHLNSIMQPAVAAHVPLVGVAITAEVAVPGSGTGVTHLIDVESVVRFCIEVAKAFGAGACRFHDPNEFIRLRARYGDMTHFQTLGNVDPGER